MSKSEHDLTPDFMEVAEPRLKDSDKNRKYQSEEDFIIQKNQYANGPVIQTDDWLFNEKLYDPTSKVGRGYLKNAAERAYFSEDYTRVLDILNIAKDWHLGTKDRQELDTIREHAEKKLNK